MTAPALARLTSVAVVGAAGLLLGHVLNPWPGGGVRPVPLAAFALALAVVGAWRGRREVAVQAHWDGAPAAPGAAARRAALGAAAALLAAALAYAAVHGG